jgi:DNA-binding MarR family transcriptional regulator
MPMSRLAANASSSLSRLSHVVARLESQGWVRRERHVADGRVQLAVLTDAGMDKVRSSAPGHVEEVQRLIFDVLDPAQIQQLDALCEKLIEGVRPGNPR